MTRRDRGSHIVEFALVLALIAGVALVSAALYATVMPIGDTMVQIQNTSDQP